MEIHLSPDGKYLFSLDEYYQLYQFDTATGEFLVVIDCHIKANKLSTHSYLNQFRVSEDGSKIYLINELGFVSRLFVHDQRELKFSKTKHEK